ncbi:hypothetical protein ACI3EY_16510 [Ornithinimicrobium sp. LYQ92]|uniref:hypothetical protein n=1 Tax=Serinicoccus sp. LYQ92 TaxID=3378798 RepID=UPI003853EE3B
MTTIAEALQAVEAAQPVRVPTPKHPKGWEPGHEWDGTQGTITTPPRAERPTTWDRYIRESGLDPADVEVIEPVQVRGWQNYDGVWLHYFRLTLRKRHGDGMPDLQALLKSARASRAKTKTPPETVESAMVVCWADPQVGKVARRGGTPELIARVAEYQAKIDALAKAWKCDAAYLLDLGDSIEGFESGGGPMAQAVTNDLSLMDQVDVAATLEFELLRTLAQTHSRVVLAGVGSNHCRWRAGKTNLGNPGDDWGIFVLKQIHRRIQDMPEKFGHVSVTWPDTHEETLSLDIAGTIVGLTHGHQAGRADKIPDWWAKQVHGGQPTAHADLLIYGHFHHLNIKPSGMNPHTGKAKWAIGAPTCDNGSDWYRMTSGADSDPNLLVFRVTKNGWDRLTLL